MSLGAVSTITYVQTRKQRTRHVQVFCYLRGSLGTMALKQFSKKEEFERVNMLFTMQNIPPSSYDLQLRTLKPWFHRRLVPDMDLKPRLSRQS
ncbi:hypothetical protein ASPCAL12660 [Aspergillus calidoustus]|uniref:Uncharacterized protein n=1 Tax=Aspergillus calidoustus TaxID=454130 RepID=A0A0U4ZJ08_ASPCI|nr:hypothetical protein ASPCAL12660 [Aspergillus calidoustus]